MKTKAIIPATLAFIVFAFTSCTIIRPGEVALDVHLGKIKRIVIPGHYHTATFGRSFVKFDTRIKEYEGKFNFHTSEGIEINCDLTITYHLIPDSAKSIYTNFGIDYQDIVIIDNLTNVIRREGVNHKALELLDVKSEMEDSIKIKMNDVIRSYGFDVDLVLLTHLTLPPQVVSTIEAKLNAAETSKKTEIDLEIKRKNRDYDIETQKKEAELEITKQRLTIDFAIEKQKKESERLIIESEAIKKSQELISTTITDQTLKLKALEITRDLVKSPNAKIIITDGKSPVILSDK